LIVAVLVCRRFDQAPPNVGVRVRVRVGVGPVEFQL